MLVHLLVSFFFLFFWHLAFETGSERRVEEIGTRQGGIGRKK